MQELDVEDEVEAAALAVVVTLDEVSVSSFRLTRGVLLVVLVLLLDALLAAFDLSRPSRRFSREV